ncbi:hypothetical protein RUM44_003310 [Polyplax serrata]|uniref:Uncharacterized protein n=1 Tax=Polyplax serrata TaxID=468196 RepID=A0ABR1AG47_POLSC
MKNTESTVNTKETFEIPKTPDVSKKLEAKNYITMDIGGCPSGAFMKNLKWDPRSPTVGINRTPIIVSTLDSSITHDSPVSIYSPNCSSSSVQDIMTPTEPSVNVSGFSETRNIENVLTRSLENLQIVNKPCEPVKPLLLVSNKPTTAEAIKLFEEINFSDNFLKKGKLHSKEIRGCKPPENKGSNEFKVSTLRNRTPLLNITSSGNSPTPLIQPSKMLNKRKASAHLGVENNSPGFQHLAYWDTNNTIII